MVLTKYQYRQPSSQRTPFAWPPYTAQTREYVQLDIRVTRLNSDLHGKECALLDSIPRGGRMDDESIATGNSGSQNVLRDEM